MIRRNDKKEEKQSNFDGKRQNIEKQLPSSIKDLFSDDEESDNMNPKEENKDKKNLIDANKSIPLQLFSQNNPEEIDDEISSFFRNQEKNETEKFLSIKKFWEDASEFPSTQIRNEQSENPQDYFYETNYIEVENASGYENPHPYYYNIIENPQNSSYFSSIPDSQIKESLMFPKFLNPEYKDN